MSSDNNGKIEENCIAKVFNNVIENNGKLVTVGRFIGKPTGVPFAHEDMWVVDRPMYCSGFESVYYMREVCLQRIDDGNLTEEELAAEEGLVLISNTGEEIT